MSHRATIEEMAAHFQAAQQDVGPPWLGPEYCRQLYGFRCLYDRLFWAVRCGARPWEPEVEDE